MMNQFLKGDADTLISTDVSSRGIDTIDVRDGRTMLV